ncbi:FecR domain-containing protein, partial [Verrucomicrobium sp. BvORR034]|uniref:FecR domain-containing protein n=1 Tax=Verrucomicrobium sp. BvORR034 TaxID=1396418 RepID=UPI002240F0B7
MNTMQWQQLASRAADGTLSQEEGAQLLVLCRESHEAREALTKVMAVERLLPLALGDPRGMLAAKEVVLRLEDGTGTTDQSIEVAWRAAEKARSWLWGKRLRKLGAVAAALALLGSAGWLALENSKPAVSYTRSEALTWAGAPPSTHSTGLARGTRLQASAGLLELGFSSGARMVLEAPFDVELRDGLTAYLHSGRVTVRCPSSAHGFTVLTPYGKVVDRGTEFCVDLNRTTRKMEVHVLEGMVEATVPKQSP